MKVGEYKMLSKNAKLTAYKEFILDDTYTVECNTYETRYSWGHYAKLVKNGYVIDESKFTYYNRTWEAYTYQSIIHSLLDKNKLSHLKYRADEIGEGNVKRELKQLGAIVAMAGIIGTPDTQVKALETATGGAVEKPDNWNGLSEEEKEKRLDKVLEVLN